MDDNQVTSSLIFVVISIFSCQNCQELLDVPLTWSDANKRCNLSLNTGNFTVIGGGSVWIRKRSDFTNWMAIEDCSRYNLDADSFSKIRIEGDNPVFECQEKCVDRSPLLNKRFGLQDNGSIQCLCNTRISSPFGLSFGSCTPKRCIPGDIDSQELCAGNDGLLVYHERTDASFRGTGKCGAFRRTGSSSFEPLALSCFETHGYLKLSRLPEEYLAVTNQVLPWSNTVRTAFTNNERISDRDKELRIWANISLDEWPLNVTLWVAVTRRSKFRQDTSSCDSCYCVAVHRTAGGSLKEKLMDCSIKLQSLCIPGSTLSIAPEETRFDDNTTEISTKSNIDATSSRPFPVTILIIIIISIMGVLLVILSAFLIRRYKRKQKTETTDEPRPTSIYYSEIRSAKSVKINNYTEGTVSNDRKRKEEMSNDFDNGEYDQIGRANKFRDISLEDETYSHARKPKQFDSNEYHTKTDADNNLYDHAS